MKPGHEDCGHDIERIHAFGQQEPIRELLHCDHDHREPIHADDRLGTGPIVADYCHCCDTITRRADYR